MAAVFPLDTTKPWTFNGVTYEYDAAEDRWFVISTTKTDAVDETLETLARGLDVTNTVIDQEIENRSNLLDAAATKNNQQDASINELNTRVDALASSSGKLEFKGRYTYVLEKTTEACTAAYAQCLLEAGGDIPAMSECNRLKDECDAAISDPYPAGSFTSKGTTNVIADIEEFLITTVDADGQTIDWLNTAEEGDYLEFFDTTDGDTALFEIVDEPAIANTEQTIRVKFISQTGAGDGNFNLQQSYDIRVFKVAQGIDLSEADARYVVKPYVVYFEDTPADITPVHSSGNLRNGELWFDTSSLQMFVWNNNAWVATSPPPSQDIVVSSALDDISRISGDVTALTQEVTTIENFLETRKSIYYSDDNPTPVGPDGVTSTLKNGDIWIDSGNLELKFYSQGAWINPDQTSSEDAIAVFKPANFGWKVNKNTTNKPNEGYVSCTNGRISSKTTFMFSLKSLEGGFNMLNAPAGTTQDIYYYTGSSSYMTAMTLNAWVYQTGGTSMWMGTGEVREITLHDDFLLVELNSHVNNNETDFDDNSTYYFSISGFF